LIASSGKTTLPTVIIPELFFMAPRQSALPSWAVNFASTLRFVFGVAIFHALRFQLQPAYTGCNADANLRRW
jgi:hypothetical protein